MHELSQSHTANRLLLPPSSSLLFKLGASNRVREWILVIPPYSGQMGSPHSKERDSRGDALGRLQLKGKFCSHCLRSK